MTIRHSYRFQPLQIGLAYLSPKTRCILCAFNTLIRLTIKYLYEILSLKNGLTKLFYFEHPTLQGVREVSSYPWRCHGLLARCPFGAQAPDCG